MIKLINSVSISILYGISCKYFPSHENRIRFFWSETQTRCLLQARPPGQIWTITWTWNYLCLDWMLLCVLFNMAATPTTVSRLFLSGCMMKQSPWRLRGPIKSSVFTHIYLMTRHHEPFLFFFFFPFLKTVPRSSFGTPPPSDESSLVSGAQRMQRSPTRCEGHDLLIIWLKWGWVGGWGGLLLWTEWFQ